MAGSSPHTRGAPQSRPRGIQPTGDHPRIRGEHAAKATSGLMSAGSSPHTRGAHTNIKWLKDHGRIIPAYAGSTTATGALMAGWWDHPRIRGEHSPAPAPSPSTWGSSPHTRGARPGGPRTPLRGRIIPAYAGSTRRRRSASPRGGIIPAYAGSTSKAYGTASRVADHPRIRGEHTRSHAQRGWGGGSSPHTRGAHQLQPFRAGNYGIIPAYAGSTHMTAPAC